MRFLFLSIVLILTIRATAQEADSTRTIPRFTLKTPVSAWLNPLQQSAIVAGDIRISRQFSLDWSTAYIFNSSQAEFSDEVYRGPRLHAGFKWFVGRDRPTNLFLGAELQYYDVDYQLHQRFSRAGGRYTEVLRYIGDHRMVGGFVRFGCRGYLERKKRLMIELDMGLGQTRHWINNQLPSDTTIDDCIDCRGGSFGPFDRNGVYFRPGGIFALQLGWAFW
jgi:hypothetical protein